MSNQVHIAAVIHRQMYAKNTGKPSTSTYAYQNGVIRYVAARHKLVSVEVHAKFVCEMAQYCVAANSILEHGSTTD